jgi:hypothetical protein
MRWESETVLRELIEHLTQELASEMMNLPNGASEPPEEMLTAMIELEDLRSELEFLRGNRPGSYGPEAGAARRRERDRQLIARMTAEIGKLFPRCPRPELESDTIDKARVLSRMIMTLKRDASQEAALAAFAESQQDVSSPNFHKWLTNDTNAAHFAVSKNDMPHSLRTHGF